MFRVKNVRGATVAKNNNFSPAIQTRIVNKPVANKLESKVINEKEQQLNNKKSTKIQNKYQIKTVIKTNKKDNDQKAKLIHHGLNNLNKGNKIRPPSRPRQSRNISRPNRNQINIDKDKKLSLQTNNQLDNKKTKQNYVEQVTNQIKTKESKTNQIQSSSQDLINVDQPQSIRKIKLLKEKEQQILKQKEKYQQIQIQKQIEKQKQIQLQRLKQQRLRKRKQQQQAQKIRLEQAQTQIQRIMQRRKQRQLDRAREKEFQRQKQNQLKLIAERINKEQVSLTGGGMMYTNDPLAHFQFTDLIMDAQINKILKTPFNHFPSGEQIQIQKSELQRINTSYMMIKQDKNNERLAEGLKNYRVELFNRIGQLIMNDQSQGFKPTNFSLIQSDPRNKRVNQQAQLLRGIPKDKINKVIESKIAKSNQECSICLQQINIGQKCNILPCKHVFHIECSNDWVQMTANCPSCRQNLKI